MAGADSVGERAWEYANEFEERVGTLATELLNGGPVREEDLDRTIPDGSARALGVVLSLLRVAASMMRFAPEPNIGSRREVFEKCAQNAIADEAEALRIEKAKSPN